MSTAARAVLINIDAPPEVVFETVAKVGATEKGKPYLMPLEPGRWNAHMARLVGKGTVRVTVSRQKGARSNQQNKYLWAVVYQDYLDGLRALAADLGLECPFRDKDELHSYLKSKYIGQTVREFAGETFALEPSTTHLDIEQFSTYVAAIMAEAAQRGIYIRSAGEDEGVA